MRNITFTSALALAAMALPSAAQTEADLVGNCYSRSYSAEHLAKNPRQTVAALSLLFRAIDGFPDAHMSAEVYATMADTPGTRADGVAGQTLEQWTFCQPLARPWNGGPKDAWIKTGRMTCFVECDGGMFQITKTGSDSLTIRTNGIALGEDDGCAGFSVMADEGAKPGTYEATTYKLYAAPLAACVVN